MEKLEIITETKDGVMFCTVGEKTFVGRDAFQRAKKLQTKLNK